MRQQTPTCKASELLTCTHTEKGKKQSGGINPRCTHSHRQPLQGRKPLNANRALRDAAVMHYSLFFFFFLKHGFSFSLHSQFASTWMSMWTRRPTQLRFALRGPPEGFRLAAFLPVGEAGERSVGGGGCPALISMHPLHTHTSICHRIACSLSSLLHLIPSCHSSSQSCVPVLYPPGVLMENLQEKQKHRGKKKKKKFVLMFLGVLFIRKTISYTEKQNGTSDALRLPFFYCL